jgi:hypothetical protein
MNCLPCEHRHLDQDGIDSLPWASAGPHDRSLLPIKARETLLTHVILSPFSGLTNSSADTSSILGSFHLYEAIRVTQIN